MTVLWLPGDGAVAVLVRFTVTRLTRKWSLHAPPSRARTRRVLASAMPWARRN
jgi:hypothetical protein